MKPFLLASALLLHCALPLFAETPTVSEQRVHEIAETLRCPTCQGLSVNDSEAGFSVQIRNKVRELLGQGKSESEIQAYFVERYGEWILRTPPAEGINLLIWILPAIGLAGGMWFVWNKSRQWKLRAEGSSKSSEQEQLSPEEERLVMTDLKRFENS